MRGLGGKVGIVAGGSSGIGAATAMRLAEEGAKVVVGGRRAERVEETVARIRAAGGTATGVVFDGGCEADVHRLVAEAVDAFGGLDFYHSNLAGGPKGDRNALDCPPDVFDGMVRLNAHSHLFAVQAALPELLKRGGGAMLFTSSAAAIAGNPVGPGYAMAKASVHALARHVARRWGKEGIRANVVCPGLVLTETALRELPEKMRQTIAHDLPHRRLGQPEDIAAAAAFLLSDDGEWVNGQVWHVNGGMAMRD